MILSFSLDIKNSSLILITNTKKLAGIEITKTSNNILVKLLNKRNSSSSIESFENMHIIKGEAFLKVQEFVSEHFNKYENMFNRYTSTDNRYTFNIKNKSYEILSSCLYFLTSKKTVSKDKTFKLFECFISTNPMERMCLVDRIKDMKNIKDIDFKHDVIRKEESICHLIEEKKDEWNINENKFPGHDINYEEVAVERVVTDRNRVSTRDDSWRGTPRATGTTRITSVPGVRFYNPDMPI